MPLCLHLWMSLHKHSGTSLIRTSTIRLLRYPALISVYSIYAHGAHGATEVAILDRLNTWRGQNFDRPKPEEAKIRQLFAPTSNNMTGKEKAVLIANNWYIIDPICMMIRISGYFTYLAMVWSHCSRIKRGSTVHQNSYPTHTYSKAISEPYLSVKR